MTPRRLCLPFFAVCLLTSCRKDVPKGTLISANGYVVDTVTGQRVPGATVYLVGGTAVWGMPAVGYANPPLDSTTADGQGNFTLSYRARGNYVDYALTVANIAAHETLPGARCIPASQAMPWLPFQYAHSLSDVALPVLATEPMKLHLVVGTNPYDTLYLRLYTPDAMLYLDDTFIGPRIDTTLTFPCLPQARNILWYRIFSSVLTDSNTTFYRLAMDSLQPPPGDTPILERNFPSAYDIPLQN